MTRASMSRMHFRDLAEGLESVMPHPDSNAYEAEAFIWEACVRQVALTCRRFNTAFDSGKFYEASGYEEVEARIVYLNR